MWPTTVGRGAFDYLDETAAGLNRKKFEMALREYVSRHSSKLKLSKTIIQVLFDSSEDYRRQYNAVQSMKRDKLREDWKRRSRFVKLTLNGLRTVGESVSEYCSQSEWPSTSLAARFVHGKLFQLNETLAEEFATIKRHQRLSERALIALSLKTLRADYIAELDHFIGQVVFP